jgi:hypothetical protein
MQAPMASGCNIVGNGWGNACTGRVQGTAGLLELVSPFVGLISPVVGAFLPVLLPRKDEGRATTAQTPLGTATSQAQRDVDDSGMTKTILFAGAGLLALYLLTRRK